MTDAGLKPIENLTPGDLVLTRHHGYCPLSWVGQRHLEEGALGAALRPIVLHPGSLAPARPARTLIVSPKLQVSMPSAADQGPDIKCRAQDLMGRPGVERVAPGDTIYIMIALEVPDMVQAEGIWCAAADGTATPEALFLFPELQTAEPA